MRLKRLCRRPPDEMTTGWRCWRKGHVWTPSMRWDDQQVCHRCGSRRKVADRFGKEAA